jgi:hypothetical protein
MAVEAPSVPDALANGSHVGNGIGSSGAARKKVRPVPMFFCLCARDLYSAAPEELPELCAIVIWI